MACKESVCRKCFHSYVCEKFNENKDDTNEKCHFFNDHYVPTADVVPRAEVEALEREIARLKKSVLPSYCQAVSEEEALKIGKEYGKAEVAGEIVEFLFRRSKSLQHLFKDNPDSAQCFRGRFELENAAIIIANEYGVDLKKKHTEGE
jgi:hypothetical protein